MLESLLSPQTIAVMGASQTPGKVGHEVVANLINGGYQGTIVPVNPKADEILGLKWYHDLKEYSGKVDLAVIVVVGDVTPELASRVIEKYFGTWHAMGPKPDTVLPPVPLNQAATTTVPDTSRIQDKVTLGETIGITRSDPGFYALQLGNNVLGGGFYSTRLSRDLRKNTGLVYSVGSLFDIGKSRGMYFVQYACDPGNVSKVHTSIVRELDDLRKSLVTADELQRAKIMLISQIQLEEGSTDGITQGLIRRWDLDLPLDEPAIAAQKYIQISAEDVRAAFANWLRPEDLVRVTQGPQPL